MPGFDIETTHETQTETDRRAPLCITFEMAVPAAVLHIDCAHFDTGTPGLGNQHRYRIEAHRLCIDQSADECSRPMRSEEHTSELQSLMRISYAVFCLKKKTKQKNTKTQQHHQKQTKRMKNQLDLVK